MDRGEAGVETLVIGRIGGVADADQLAVGCEQASSAAAVDRLAGRRVVGLALVLVDGRDMRRADAWVGALVATNGEDAVARPNGAAGRRNADGSHGRGRAKAAQGDVAIEIVGDELAVDGLGCAGSKQIGRDLALTL